MIKNYFKKFYKKANRFINPHKKLPLTRNFGFYRGTPLDRYFINNWVNDFLNDLDPKNRLKGLEIGGFDYLVPNSKLYISNELVPQNKFKKYENSLCIDLNKPIKKKLNINEKFDFIIFTQVLHVLKNDINGLEIIKNLLKKDGLIIGSVAGTINPISIYDYERWGCYRGYSDQGLRSLFDTVGLNCSIKTIGNFGLAYEFLNGSVIEDIDQELLNENDKLFQVLLLFKAYKNN